jgi:hypothetical protein
MCNNLFAQTDIVLSEFTVTLNVVANTKHSQFKVRKSFNHPAEIFFQEYFYPASLSAYEKLYRTGDFYGLTKDQFSTWQATMRNSTIHTDHIIFFNIEQMKYAALPYYADFDDYIHRHVKLAKYLNGRWFPLSRQEDIELAEIKHLFSTVNSTFLQQLVNKEDNRSRFEDSGWNIIDNQIRLSQINQLRSDTYLNPAYNIGRAQFQPFQSSIEWTNKGRNKFNNQAKPEIMAWLSSIQMPQKQIDEVVHLLLRGEQIQAVVKIDDYENDDQKTANDYIKQLKDIFSKF